MTESSSATSNELIRLQDEVKVLTHERDIYKKSAEDLLRVQLPAPIIVNHELKKVNDQLQAQVETLTRERNELRRQVRFYGGHLDHCPRISHSDNCECGYKKAWTDANRQE